MARPASSATGATARSDHGDGKPWVEFKAPCIHQLSYPGRCTPIGHAAFFRFGVPAVPGAYPPIVPRLTFSAVSLSGSLDGRDSPWPRVNITAFSMSAPLVPSYPCVPLPGCQPSINSVHSANRFPSREERPRPIPDLFDFPGFIQGDVRRRKPLPWKHARGTPWLRRPRACHIRQGMRGGREFGTTPSGVLVGRGR